MDELFSLSISEGAICNILARARRPLLDATAAIEKVVLASPVVCSDETSVRVKGKNWGSTNETPLLVRISRHTKNELAGSPRKSARNAQRSVHAAGHGDDGKHLFSVIAAEGSRRWQAREFGGFLRVDRRAVLVTSPYAYQKASWLVPAK